MVSFCMASFSSSTESYMASKGKPSSHCTAIQVERTTGLPLPLAVFKVKQDVSKNILSGEAKLALLRLHKNIHNP